MTDNMFAYDTITDNMFAYDTMTKIATLDLVATL